MQRFAMGILLAAALTGPVAGAEDAGNAAAQANNPLANMTALNFQDYYIGRITAPDERLGSEKWSAGLANVTGRSSLDSIRSFSSSVESSFTLGNAAPGGTPNLTTGLRRIPVPDTDLCG
jgi:hypothetical protein